jgi:hypothetical protein
METPGIDNQSVLPKTFRLTYSKFFTDLFLCVRVFLYFTRVCCDVFDILKIQFMFT